MDSLEINKAIASILVAGIAFMGAGFIGDIVVNPTELKKTAIEIQGVPAEGAPAAQPQAPQVPPIVPLLASADLAKGKQLAETDCTICHNFQEGKGPKVGPDLYGVVGRPRASKAGFDYSAGLKKLGGTWTYPNLNHWLFDPHMVVPDTRMAFAGIKNTKQRADVIAFLRTLSPKPEPLPTAEEVKAAEQQAAQAKAGTSKASAIPPAATQQPGVKAGPPQPSFVSLVAKASPEKGKDIAETQCSICHNFKEGQGPKIGPDLYGVVGRPRASKPGFDYSTGLKKIGGKWTYENLNHWLAGPMSVVPDTHMIFPGIKSEKQRAEVVAFLRTLSDHPLALPQPAAAPAAQPAPKQAAAAPSAAKPAPAAPANTAQPAAPQPAAFAVMVAHASPDKGQQIAETDCAICHNFKEGAGAKIGPDLYGVVGRPRAGKPGFDYTEGLKKLGGTWTYANLNEWLTNPMAMVPGTRMMFPGIKSEKQRAEVVAFLRTLSPHPVPLPTAAANAGQTQAAPALPGPPAPKPGNELVTPAPTATSGTQAAPAAGGTTQENPAERASPAGAGLPGQQPQAGAVGSPTPAIVHP